MALEHAAKEAARGGKYRRDDDGNDAAYEQRYQRDSDDTSHDDYWEQKQQQKTEQGPATLRPTIVRRPDNPGRKLFIVIAILAIIAALALLGFDVEEVVNELLGV